MNVEIRPAVSSDAEACGRISYEAFKGIRERHGFPPHFPLWKLRSSALLFA